MRRFLLVCALMVSFPLVVRADLIHVTSRTQFTGQTCVTCTHMIGAGSQFDTFKLQPGDSFAYAVPATLLVSSSGYLDSQFLRSEAIHLEKNYTPFWHHEITNGKEIADHLPLGVDTMRSKMYQYNGRGRLPNWHHTSQPNLVRPVPVPEPTSLELLLPAAITLWFAGWRKLRKDA